MIPETVRYNMKAQQHVNRLAFNQAVLILFVYLSKVAVWIKTDGKLLLNNIESI